MPVLVRSVMVIWNSSQLFAISFSCAAVDPVGTKAKSSNIHDVITAPFVHNINKMRYEIPLEPNLTVLQEKNDGSKSSSKFCPF